MWWIQARRYLELKDFGAKSGGNILFHMWVHEFEHYTRNS